MKAFTCLIFLCAIAYISAAPQLFGNSGSAAHSEGAGLSLLGGLVSGGVSKNEASSFSNTGVLNHGGYVPVGVPVGQASSGAAATNHNAGINVLGIPLINANHGTATAQSQSNIRYKRCV